MLYSVFVGTLVAASLLTVASWRLGGFRSAWLYLAGHRLLVSPAAFVVSEGEPPSSKRVTITNLTGARIRLVGATPSCNCTVVENVPCSIEAGRTASIAIQVDPSEMTPTATSRVILLFDNKSYATSTVTVKCESQSSSR